MTKKSARRQKRKGLEKTRKTGRLSETVKRTVVRRGWRSSRMSHIGSWKGRGQLTVVEAAMVARKSCMGDLISFYDPPK